VNGMTADDLLSKVKAHLILEHDSDDALLRTYIAAATAYAEGYQHLPRGTYSGSSAEGELGEASRFPPTTEQAILMLSSHFYESRDGSTGGFFADNIQASRQVWDTVNMLLRLDRDWKV
jgi:hypothetical protein